tara:strand:- start:1849 stop:2349 length:501 start_codon:yes stop_codon:yes gene_type:complete
MAVTNVSLSDAVSAWVTKTNTIASDLGDRAALETTASGNLVAAINEIHGKALDTDSASTRLLFSGNKGLSYNSTTGQFNVDSNNIIAMVENSLKLLDSDRLKSLIGLHPTTSGKFSDTATINFDSSGPRMSIQNSCITSSLFNSPVTLTIYDSGGSALKVLRSPGS